jgi:hypothetical protein
MAGDKRIGVGVGRLYWVVEFLGGLASPRTGVMSAVICMEWVGLLPTLGEPARKPTRERREPRHHATHT